MKKFLIIALAVCGLSTTASAQISDANPTAKTIKVGNRAKKGDFGIYIGMTSSKFGFQNTEGIGGKFKVNPIPLVNLKYMITDRWEARLGLEFTKYYEGLTGEYTIEKYDEKGDRTFKTNDHYTQTENNIYPGFAYHFSKSNILDVYAGAELQLGWNRNIVNTSADLKSDYYSKQQRRSFQIGAGAFIGLQAYICNLPLAIGVEYGIYSLLQTGQKTRHESRFGSDSDKSVTYTTDASQLPEIFKNGAEATAYGTALASYDKLGAQKGSVGNQFRVTLSYFFNR